MADYKALYFQLFAGIADAIDALEQTNYGQAKALLIELLQKAEEAVIADE